MKEIKDHQIVNLGVGFPSSLIDYLAKDHKAIIHSENGILRLGHKHQDHHDVNTINSNKQLISIEKGGSTFSTSFSFDIIRGGHIDLCILGGV